MAMSISEVNWDQDLEADPDEEYQSLVRSLRWTDGFGLFFVQCSPAQATRMIDQLQQDLRHKQIHVVTLNSRIDNLYELVANLPDRHEIEILVINGLEESFVDYIRPGYGGQGDYYKLDTVPRVLGNLNLQRERFRDDFPISFVFFLPLFGLKYFIRRAPDFFDWRSGVFEFPTDADKLLEVTDRLFSERETLEEYLVLPPDERKRKILEVEELLRESHHPFEYRAQLLFECALLLDTAEEYEAAVRFYQQLVELDSSQPGVWFNYGLDLLSLSRFEEAIACFDHAIAIDPNFAEAWDSRGIAARKIGDYGRAIDSYKNALKIDPSFHDSRYNLGTAYLEIKNYESALALFQSIVAEKPDYAPAYYNQACIHAQLRNIEEAIEQLAKAIQLNPQKYKQLAASDPDLALIRDSQQFISLLSEE